MLSNKTKHDKIFISYRREDTQGYAGRLEDSLAAYFGPNRVFRDVGGISGGDDFSHAIAKELDGAGAVIVLIGQRWLSTVTNRQDLSGSPQDYVSLEVQTALEKNVPVFPVLVENSSMPRGNELPESLVKLATRNAISISDERWKTDVERLAKVLAIDVPGSLAELKLKQLKRAILALLLIPLVAQTLAFSWAAYVSLSNNEAFKVSTQTQDIFNFSSFSWSIPSASFIAIMAACYLLMLAKSHVERTSAKLIYSSIWIGGLGTLGSFVSYGLVFGAQEKVIAIYSASTIVIATMLGLMVLAGFKSP